MPSVGKDTPGWAAIEPKNAKQLEGLWQSLKNEADRLVRRIVDAELARERIAAPPPDPVLEAQVV
jgi:hypothetical protein